MSIYAVWPPKAESEEETEFYTSDTSFYKEDFTSFQETIYEMVLKHWSWFKTASHYDPSQFFIIKTQWMDQVHEFEATDAASFLANSVMRFRSEVEVQFFNPKPEQDEINLSYAINNDSSHSNHSIWPAAWYVRDISNNSFINKRRINKRDFRGYIHPNKDIAFWTSIHDAEDDIEELFDKKRTYQIELMDSGYLVAGISYL